MLDLSKIIELPFTITKPYTIVKATVQSEFVYGHLDISVVAVTGARSAQVVMTSNSDLLGPTLLSPGQYKLVIMEPRVLVVCMCVGSL